MIHLPRGFAGSRRVIAFVASHRKLLTVSESRSIRVSFAGIRTQTGRVVAVAIWGRKNRLGLRPRELRLYSICAKDGAGIGQINVPPAPLT